ncbi:MAG TPA: EAL domain-containing protein [Actinomycetota bacterium]|nr:EAL domain-containing protein [Actinomycetota bacterium]
MGDERRPDDLSYQQALVYARELRELYHRSRASADDMREAGEKRQRIARVLSGVGLRIVFQPISNLETGGVAGVEALARFADGRGPATWFAEAQSVDLEEDLDLAAVRAALAHLEHLPPGAFLSLNVSPATAASETFRAVLDPLPCERIVLEITEHARIEDYEMLDESLRWIRRRSGRLAVDDAGAGFASLRHILSLDPDVIKLDISLTRNVDTDRARRALARALITFANEIGAMIVAEGIETEGELQALQELGVTYGQGFHLARPARIEAVAARMSAA